MRLAALAMVWLSLFAGTFHFSYVYPDTNSDGSPLTDLHHAEWWLFRCPYDSLRLSDIPAIGANGQTQYGTVEAIGGHAYWLKGRLVDFSGNRSAARELMFALEPDTVVPPPPPPPPPDTSGTGITGKYYIGQSHNQWVTDRRDTTIDFAWGLAPPMPDMPADGWSVQWVGKIVIATSGVYTFYLESQDGGRLYINNGLYIDKWVAQPLTEWSASLNLAAGEHNIVVEYTARSAGNSECRLRYSGPGISKRIVPRGVLR